MDVVNNIYSIVTYFIRVGLLMEKLPPILDLNHNSPPSIFPDFCPRMNRTRIVRRNSF